MTLCFVLIFKTHLTKTYKLHKFYDVFFLADDSMNGLWDDVYEYIHNFAGGAQTFSGCVYNQAAGNITSCSGTSVYVICDVMI